MRAARPLLLLPLVACLAPPPAFTSVDAEVAHELLQSGRAGLVRALGPGETDGRGVVWRVDPQVAVRLEQAPPGLAEGGLLVIASRDALAMQLAAALARPRNREVWVFIPGSARERQSLYAVRSRAEEETPRGTDS